MMKTKKTQYKETALETVGEIFITLHLVACMESINFRITVQFSVFADGCLLFNTTFQFIKDFAV